MQACGAYWGLHMSLAPNRGQALQQKLCRMQLGDTMLQCWLQAPNAATLVTSSLVGGSAAC